MITVTKKSFPKIPFVYLWRLNKCTGLLRLKKEFEFYFNILKLSGNNVFPRTNNENVLVFHPRILISSISILALYLIRTTKDAKGMFRERDN